MDLFDDLKDGILPFELPNKEGYSVSWNESLCGFDIIVPKGKLFYSERFFSQKISDRTVEYLLESESHDWTTVNWRDLDKERLSEVTFRNIEWRHDKIKMYGKDVYLPRYSAWYGDSDKSYTYSGLTLSPKQWNKGLLYIKSKVDEVAGIVFNSVLINWYRDGDDCISWHADAEPELGKNPIIGSVSFGETRDFILKANDTAEKITIPLKHGTLLLMSGELQHFWKHSVPKRKNKNHARFNLTFRVVHHY